MSWSIQSITPLTISSALSIRPHPTRPHTFTSGPLWEPRGNRGVFGGQLVGLALMAASKTILPGFTIHSQHCYFISPTTIQEQLELQVELLKDGKGFGKRLVRIGQGGKEVCIVMASYTVMTTATATNTTGAARNGDSHDKGARTQEGDMQEKKKTRANREEDGDVEQHNEADGSAMMEVIESRRGKRGHVALDRFQIPFQYDVVPYNEQENDEAARWKVLQTSSTSAASQSKLLQVKPRILKERAMAPMSISRAESGGKMPDEASNTRVVWLKARLDPHETHDVETIKSIICFMSDYTFISIIPRSIGLTFTSQPRVGQMASLDHTTHFSPLPPDFDPRQPLLHVMQGVISDRGLGRGMVRGSMYTQDGYLLAVSEQEGVFRIGEDRAKL